ncbi:MAG: type 4a pilus biogenesis protein PilO [Gemmatimonadales bacterium]
MAILLLFLAAVAGYLGYDGFSGVLEGAKGRQEQVAAMRDSLAALTKEVDSAKAVLATGSIEQLRRRLEGYRQSLDLLRRLVPEETEVPNLLDQISTRSKIRGVELSGIRPGATVPGPPPFATNQYEIIVLGHYDQIGEFLSDIASLPRIIVPVGLNVQAASTQAAQVLGDSSGALLSASFTIRTYVKSGKEAADSAQ